MGISRRSFLKLTTIAAGAVTLPISTSLLGHSSADKSPMIGICEPVIREEYLLEYNVWRVTATVTFGTTGSNTVTLDRQYGACVFVSPEGYPAREFAKSECLKMLQDILLKEYSAYTPIKINLPKKRTIKIRLLDEKQE